MSITVERDVAYGTVGMTADIYVGPAPTASIMLIHGGGWFHGDKAKDEALATLLAQRGYAVCVPNYRLTPKVTFPAAREDVLAAIAWFRQSTYGSAESRAKTALWGSSAGGNLVVEGALATGLPAIDWSGPLDLLGFIEETDGEASDSSAKAQDFANISSASINQGGRNDPFLRWCILQLVGNDRSLLKDASPIFRATAKSGPVYMMHSAHDFVPADSAVKMQAALRAVGVESIVQIVPGTAHGEGNMDQALEGALTFLNRVLT